MNVPIYRTYSREESDASELDRLTTAHRWLMLECDGWRARAEHAERRIKQLIKHRGHVAVDAVIDKMEREVSSANVRNSMDYIVRHLDNCRYWQGIEECQCASPLPIGGCLKCDMDDAVELLNAIISENAQDQP